MLCMSALQATTGGGDATTVFVRVNSELPSIGPLKIVVHQSADANNNNTTSAAAAANTASADVVRCTIAQIFSVYSQQSECVHVHLCMCVCVQKQPTKNYASQVVTRATAAYCT